MSISSNSAKGRESVSSSASKILDYNENQFISLLCKFTQTRRSEARKVVKMIKDENDLQNMSQDTFLDKAKFIIEKKIYNVFCHVCLKTFKKSKNRDEHVKAVHNKIKDADLSCSQCEKSFMSRQSLNYHIDVVHTSSSAEVKCPVCDAKLGHSVSLERHMKLHKESLELHQCSLCQKQFTRKDNLTVHKKVVHRSVNLETSMTELSRQDKDSFACRVCGVKFSGERAEKELVAHLVNKCRADQRVSCNKCDRDFSSQFNMKQHERSFHNNVPKITFSCKFCDFVSQHKTSINRHEKRKHTKE